MKKISLLLLLALISSVGFAQKVPEVFRAAIVKEKVYEWNANADRYEKTSDEAIEGAITADPKRFYISIEGETDLVYLVIGKKENKSEKQIEYKCQSRGKYCNINIPFNHKKLILHTAGKKYEYKLTDFTVPAKEMRPAKDKRK